MEKIGLSKPSEAELRKRAAAAREREASGVDDPKVYDFGDGQGAVAAHRHVNPRTFGGARLGGWVAASATVSPSVVVGPDCAVYGSAKISDQVRILLASRIFGSARITGASEIANSIIGGGARVEGFAARIWGAVVMEPVTVGGRALGPKTGESRLIVERDVPGGCELHADGLHDAAGKLLPFTAPRHT